MLRLVATRLALGIVSLLLVSLAIFAITSLLPGDAAEELLGQYATRETVAGLRASLGLDLPARPSVTHPGINAGCEWVFCVAIFCVSKCFKSAMV